MINRVTASDRVWCVSLSWLLAAVIALVASGCGRFPKDPEATLERVSRGTMRVGLVENAPWVVRGKEGQPGGAEVVLLKKLAEELGSKPEWHWGGEQAHMEALEKFQLDVVIGGITRETEWRRKVGLTGAYLKSPVLVGFPPGAPLPAKLKDVPVAVKAGTAIAYLLERKGAAAQRVTSWREAHGQALAAEEWELESLGRVPSRFKLTTEKHAMAVPPGENGWIKLLDDFLQAHAAEAKRLLQAEEARE